MKFAYIAVLIAVLLASAPLLSSKSAWQREKALNRYARRMNLALTTEVRPRVISRIATYERSLLIGGVGGSLAGFGLGLVLSHPQNWGDWTPLTVFIGLGLGVMLATVTTATFSTLRTGPRQRIARTSAPRITDYVPPVERWYTPVALGCAGLVLLGATIALGIRVLHGDELQAAGMLLSSGAILGYLGFAAHLVAQHLTRRVLDAGQPAASQQELAWDDALRAATLRGLQLLPGSLATLSVLMTFVQLGAQVTNPPEFVAVVGAVGLILFVCAVAVALIADAVSRPSQHYRRRLWQPARPVGTPQGC